MWRVVVPMEQEESRCAAFEPRYSKGTDDGREWEGGGPLLTREGRGVRKNGPRRRSSLLSVLSGKPSGSPIDPRHPEISGGLRRLQRRVHRHLGTFWAVSGG